MLGTFIISTGALILAVGLAAAIALGVALFRWVPGRGFQWLFLACAVAGVVNTLLSQRVLTRTEAGLIRELEGDPMSGMAGRLLVVAIIVFSLAICAAWAIWTKRDAEPRNRYVAAGRLPPTDISVSFLVYLVAFSVLPIAFAPQFMFRPSLVYPLFVFAGLLIALRYSTVDPVVVAKQVLAFIVATSLIAVVALPALALEPGYRGLLPGFSTRLWGATAHANSLGAVASVLLVLEFSEPFKRRWLHFGVLAITAVALLWSQSKTGIAAAALGLGVVIFWRLWTVRRGPGSMQRALAARTFLVFLAALAVGLVWVVFFNERVFEGVLARLDSGAVANLATATGRTRIWQYALERGLESPMFGHGASMWSLETRFQAGLRAAAHAHNLYLQAFTRSGVVGLLALLVFLFFLVRYAVRAAVVTRGGSIALLLVFLIRSVFEVPINVQAVTGAEFFALVTLLAYCIDRGARADRASRSAKGAYAVQAQPRTEVTDGSRGASAAGFGHLPRDRVS